MKFDKLKIIPSVIKQILSPQWKKIALLLVLFLVLPQKISNDFTFFGGVYLIKNLVETYQPSLDLYIFVIILGSSYLLVSLVVWIYDNKINRFIVTEGEEEVNPPEDASKEEPKQEKTDEPPAEQGNA